MPGEATHFSMSSHIISPRMILMRLKLEYILMWFRKVATRI